MRIGDLPCSRGASFQWVVAPDDALPTTAVWYFDGSLYDGPRQLLARTGFGIAIVDTNGALRGYGLGCPPSWVTSSAGAEIWAMFVVLSECPWVPPMITDCLGILDSLASGLKRVTAASSPLARLWTRVGAVLDGDLKCPLRHGMCWMPAHGGVHTINVATKSNGATITAVDWRANRLVDALAKAAANSVRIDAGSRRMLGNAAAAAEYGAALAGATGQAANTCVQHSLTASGQSVRTVCRDSKPQGRPSSAVAVRKPYAQSRSNGPGDLVHSRPPCRAPFRTGNTMVSFDAPLRHSSTRATRARARELAALSRQTATWRQRVDASHASATSAHIPADVRMASLRARIRCKDAVSAAVCTAGGRPMAEMGLPQDVPPAKRRRLRGSQSGGGPAAAAYF